MILIKNKQFSKLKKWIILGIPVLFIIGSIMHFIYDLSGQMTVIGIFAPVNESVWEHLKMILLPMVGWWSIYYIINRKKYLIDKEKWFFASVSSLIASMLTVSAFYYTYTQAFGIESLILDIFDLLLSIIVGQSLGFHIYKYGKKVNINVSIIIIVLIIIVFVIFTFYPPHIPLFKDATSGQYGI